MNMQLASFSFMRRMCIKPMIGISSVSMSILQRPAAEEESAIDMIERLLSGTKMAEVDPFIIKVLLKLARAEEKVLTAQQEVLTAQQEVKTLEAEKALLARDLQTIFLEDFRSSSRGLIEYVENWMMKKKGPTNRVDKWIYFFEQDPRGINILKCTLEKNKLWIQTPRDVAIRIEGFFKVYSDPHHSTAHMIEEKQEFNIPNELAGEQYINLLECICDIGCIDKKWF